MAEKRRKSATLPHYWTPGQIGLIIAAIPPGPHKLVALTLWRTGLRCAEALALEWRDIRLGDEPMVTVRNGKGGKARQVPIHPELRRALELVRHGRPAERVFSFSLRTADRLVKDAIAGAGVAEAATGTGDRDASTHSFRHSAARHWLDQGKPVNVVQLWLGHSSPKFTLDTYLPLAPGELGDMDDIA